MGLTVRNVSICWMPEKSFFFLGVPRAGEDLVVEGGGLAGYNLTVWIRETQLNLLRGLEGAGAAKCR